MKVELSVAELQAVTLDPRDSALVIVDMQNEYLSPDGKRFLARGAAALNALVPLLEQFRSVGSKVIHVQSVRSRDCLEFTVFAQAPKLLENTWGAEIVATLAPRAQEPVVEKNSHDPFNNTTMERVLAASGLRPGRSRIVVTGVATQGCVDCAVTGFSVRDYVVYVPIDCTAAATEELELLGFAHFFGRGYEYNVFPTRSDLIGFAIATRVKAGDLQATR